MFRSVSCLVRVLSNSLLSGESTRVTTLDLASRSLDLGDGGWRGTAPGSVCVCPMGSHATANGSTFGGLSSSWQLIHDGCMVCWLGDWSKLLRLSVLLTNIEVSEDLTVEDFHDGCGYVDVG